MLQLTHKEKAVISYSVKWKELEKKIKSKKMLVAQIPSQNKMAEDGLRMM